MRYYFEYLEVKDNRLKRSALILHSEGSEQVLRNRHGHFPERIIALMTFIVAQMKMTIGHYTDDFCHKIALRITVWVEPLTTIQRFVISTAERLLLPSVKPFEMVLEMADDGVQQFLAVHLMSYNLTQ